MERPAWKAAHCNCAVCCVAYLVPYSGLSAFCRSAQQTDQAYQEVTTTMTEPRMLAVCGLDCGSCSIRRLPFDESAAEEAINWYREQGWLTKGEGAGEAMARLMYCKGCRSDRSVHWSPDCWILHCCVEERHLEYCSECEAFPCRRLVDWSKTDKSYEAALKRLRAMRQRRMS